MPHITVKNLYHKHKIFVKNKYIITALFFFITIVCIDEENIFQLYALIKKKKGLQRQKELYIYQIKNIKKEKKRLDDPIYLIKYARENFYMKNKNEDLYIIE